MQPYLEFSYYKKWTLKNALRSEATFGHLVPLKIVGALRGNKKDLL